MPASFTTPPTATNGNVIASSHVNIHRDNSEWFNQLLSGPSAQGQVPISTSTTAATYGYVTAAQIQALAVTTAKLQDSSVTEAKIADGTVTLTELASAVTAVMVPIGLCGWVRKASEIASGWSRETNLDGRMVVGDGTTFSTTFVEATNYGSTWGPHTHTASGTLSADNYSPVDLGFDLGSSKVGAHPTHAHSLSGSTPNGSWVIPSRGYVAVRKT